MQLDVITTWVSRDMIVKFKSNGHVPQIPISEMRYQGTWRSATLNQPQQERTVNACLSDSNNSNVDNRTYLWAGRDPSNIRKASEPPHPWSCLANNETSCFLGGELERILGCTGSCASIPAFVCRFVYFRFASVLGEEKTVCEDKERPEAISEMSLP